MTATWASYLAVLGAALAAATAALVTLLVGQVAELRRRVAALDPYETGLDLAWEDEETDRTSWAVPCRTSETKGTSSLGSRV